MKAAIAWLASLLFCGALPAQAKEKRVKLKDLPAAPKAAILKAAGHGKVLSVESVGDGARIEAYEASIESGGKKSEVRVDPQGGPVPKR